MSGKIPSVTSPPWTATTKRIVLVVTLGVLLMLARQVDGATWTAIIISMLLAYLLSPVVGLIERRLAVLIPMPEVRRTLAVFLTWLLVIGLMVLLIILVVPATVAQMRDFAEDLPTLVEDTEQDLRDTLSKPIPLGNFVLVPWDELEKMFAEEEGTEGDSTLSGTLRDALLGIADHALDVVGGALSFFITLIFVLTMLFYLMRDGRQFVHYLVRSVPESYQGDARRLLYELGQIWNAYLRGQIILSVIMAVVVYCAALVLGLPQPLVLGLFAGFFEFIPNLGPALSQIPALLFALTTDSATIPALDAGIIYAVVVSVTYMSLQQLEAILIVPRVLGSSLDLHPFVVIVAILAGASFAGVLGVVLAAPSVATLRLGGRYLRAKLLDEELFPATPAAQRLPGGVIFRTVRFLLSRRFPVLPDAELAEAPPDVPPERGEPSERPDISSWAM